jgi:hypothetical protein
MRERILLGLFTLEALVRSEGNAEREPAFDRGGIALLALK